MARRDRDSQRAKVYAAERATFSWTPGPEDLDGTHAGAQAFLDRVSRSALFRDLAPRTQRTTLGRKPYSARLWVDPAYQGRTTSRAGNTYGEHRGYWRPEVSIAKSHLGLRWVLLHEASHWCVPHQRAWHGPEFCFAYHQLVSRFISEEAGDRLYAALNERGVEAAA